MARQARERHRAGASLILGAVASVAIGTTALFGLAPQIVGEPQVREAPPPQPTPAKASHKPAVAAERRHWLAVRATYGGSTSIGPVKHRASGERAHRRWRFRRAAGRA